ncbi:HalOD1 output domain-containing protein [Halobaculum sp. EA56]|uniref:HalOD1 output domain-containing protein n=1 Tax=Halobaculum sp. EA56 TaxID=3421648 RepID=UPI003EBB579D
MGAGSTVTGRVVEGIAAKEGTEPEQLELTVHEYLDAEALEQLVDHGRAEWELHTRIGGHDIRVYDDGTVVVDGKPTTESPR